MIHILYSFLAGIIQGITEWLPISSTGHLILLDSLFNNFGFRMSEDFINMFDVVIQFGSILAIVVLYFRRLNPFAPSKSRSEKNETWSLWLKIVIACIPAGVIGLAFDDLIEERIFTESVRDYVIAGALIFYGILFIIIERKNKDRTFKIDKPEQVTPKTALAIGAFQVLALIPGTSRSGSTIIGSSLLGVSRTAAAEFSFFLAIPIMLGASGLKILKYALKAVEGTVAVFTGTEFLVLIIGTLVSFLVSLVAVRFLVGFVRKHSFEAFGWYRIALGIVVFVWLFLAR